MRKLYVIFIFITLANLFKKFCNPFFLKNSFIKFEFYKSIFVVKVFHDVHNILLNREIKFCKFEILSNLRLHRLLAIFN